MPKHRDICPAGAQAGRWPAQQAAGCRHPNGRANAQLDGQPRRRLYRMRTAESAASAIPSKRLVNAVG